MDITTGYLARRNWLAKRNLFSTAGSDCIGIINIDDDYGKRLLLESSLHNFSFGQQDGADLRLVSAETTVDGTSLCMAYKGVEMQIESQLLGSFNVENIMAAIATALALGIEFKIIQPAIAAIKPVRGRMEPVPNDRQITVIVDYAHTDAGLLNLLKSAREISDGRIITIFGCGGDRDKGKRPLMGKHAFELSDVAIITSDNPRTENPLQIIAEVKAGMKIADPCKAEIMTLPDRRAAIEEGIAFAEPGDTVLIAGKGHEDYQIIGTTRIDLDDREIAMEALQR